MQFYNEMFVDILSFFLILSFPFLSSLHKIALFEGYLVSKSIAYIISTLLSVAYLYILAHSFIHAHPHTHSTSTTSLINFIPSK